MGGGGGGGGGGSAPRLTNATNAPTRLKLVDSHGDICPSNLQGVKSTFHHRINRIGAHIISYQA